MTAPVIGEAGGVGDAHEQFVLHRVHIEVHAGIADCKLRMQNAPLKFYSEMENGEYLAAKISLRRAHSVVDQLMTNEISRNRSLVIGVLVHDFQLGGAERVAIRLANAWSRMNAKVIMFAGGGDGIQRKLVDESVEVVVAEPPLAQGLRQFPVGLGRWVAAHAAAKGVDIFYLPGNSYFRAVGALVGSGARIYATITNSLWRIDRSMIGNVVFSALTRWRLRGVTGVISMSAALLKQERRLLGHSRVSRALPNALFESSAEVAPVVRRPWHICAVGRLVPQKNFELLLRSFALLMDLPVTLSIAGDGPQMIALRQLASTLGVAERITFLGAVETATPCIAEAEIMVLTSRYEGYPAVAVEALAVGTHVVAGKFSPAILDILQAPELGMTVNGRRPEAFAGAIRRFFSGPYRYEYARRIAMARPLVQSHVSSRAAREYLEFMTLQEVGCGAMADGPA